MENTEVYKEMERKFPKQEYTCPYCGGTATIPVGMVTANCERCGKTFFRPLPPDPAGCKEHDEGKL